MVIRDAVLATNVSFDTYMDYFAERFCEWIDGTVIRMSPVTRDHDLLSQFTLVLFKAYTAREGSAVLQAPMVMKLKGQRSGREPDIQVLLPEHMDRIKKTFVQGAADLVVEIISEDSVERDREDKFKEYERSGVLEYWILDPLRQESWFYVRNVDGRFELSQPDAEGIYQSPVLPKFRLPVALFWRDPLPDIYEVVRLVESMLAPTEAGSSEE